MRGGTSSPTPFLDIRSQVTAGRRAGAARPGLRARLRPSGRFYVYFTGRDSREHLVEYRRADADRADPATARTVLVHDDPEANHNGGMLAFGPDGLLYVGTGDGGGGDDQHGARGNAQDLGSPLGKILRIDPRASGGRPFTAPASNPFVGRAGALPEIYAYGLRNPWRFSFDRSTGDLLIGDVGQDAVEEIDFVRRGRGPRRELRLAPARGQPPQLRRTGARARCAPVHRPRRTRTAGARSPAATSSATAGCPRCYGRYVYGDFCKGQVRSVRLTRRSARPAIARWPGWTTSRAWTRSARTRRAGSTSCRQSGPVYRFAAR